MPIVQNGVTVQTTTGAIAVQPTQQQTFLTVGQQTSLPNSRSLATGTGLQLVDGGAQGTYQINLTGTALALDNLGNGIVAKTAADTLTARSIQASAGLGVTNGDGIAGNPVIALGTFMANINSLSSSTGLVGVKGGIVSPLAILGTTNQITLTSGDGSSGNPIVSIANNPVLPGNQSVTLPSGSTSQRGGSPSSGQFRYNSETGLLEFYSNNAWLVVATNTGGAAGVTSVSTGTGLTGGPITSTGTISIANTGVAAGTYTFPTITVNAQGQITSASNNTGEITTISFGTTGLTPNTPTSGDVVVAGTLAAKNGGTGQTTYANGDLLYGVATNTLSKLTLGTSGYVLTAGASAPQYVAQSTLSVGTSTNIAGGAAGSLPYQTAAATTTTLGIGTAGQVLTVNSGATAPQWTTLTGVAVTTFSGGTTGFTPNTATSGAVTLAGTLVASNGGTGVAGTLTGISYMNGTSAHTVATAAQVVSTIGTTAVTNSTNTTNILGGAAGSLPYQTGANTTSLLALGTTGYFLTAGATAPQWTQTLPVANGGTGLNSITANYVPYGNGTSALNTSSQFQYNGTYLLVGAAAALGGLTNPVAAFTGNPGTTNYVQAYVYNAQNGISSSGDFVAYASNSTDAHGWADLGFTSPTYADSLYTVTGPNEAYLFGSALNNSYTGNLVYATDSTGSANSHQWYVGGFTQAKSAWRMQLTSTSLQSAGDLEQPNTITVNFTIPANTNSMWVTPVAISAIVTVPATGSWTLI